MGQMESPSSWKVAKLVFLPKPNAEAKKGIRSHRAIALTSVKSKWYASCITLRLDKEKEPESWKQLHLGGTAGITCQHFQVMMTNLLQKTLGVAGGQKTNAVAWQWGTPHNVFWEAWMLKLLSMRRHRGSSHREGSQSTRDGGVRGTGHVWMCGSKIFFRPMLSPGERRSSQIVTEDGHAALGKSGRWMGKEERWRFFFKIWKDKKPTSFAVSCGLTTSVNTTPNPRKRRTPAHVTLSRVAQDLSHRVNRHRCVSQNSHPSYLAQHFARASLLFPSHLSTSSLSTCTPVRLSLPDYLPDLHWCLLHTEIYLAQIHWVCLSVPWLKRTRLHYEPMHLVNHDDLCVKPMFFHRPSMTSTSDSAESIATPPLESDLDDDQVRNMLARLVLEEQRDHLLAEAKSEILKQECKVDTLNTCMREFQRQAHSNRLEMDNVNDGYEESWIE